VQPLLLHKIGLHENIHRYFYLQGIRWMLKDSAGMELPPPARETIDLEGRLVKDGVRKANRKDRS
jgi:hypothetical protein